MNHKVIYSILFSATLLLCSCVSDFNADLPSGTQEILVVDGSIIENTNSIFYLSKSFSLNTVETPRDIKDIDAQLFVIGDDGFKSSPATHLGKGAYQINIGELNDNVSYGIQIEYDGETYQSTLSTPLSTPEIDSVSYFQPVKEGDVAIRISTHTNEKESTYFFWNYEEVWEIAANYYTTIFYDLIEDGYYMEKEAPYYYCWRRNTENKILVGSTEALSENKIINKELYKHQAKDDRFSILYSVLVTQRAISKGAYEYYLNKAQLNESMGGLFTPQPSEVNGNISCKTNASKKVIGYVEAIRNTSTQRIFISKYDVTRPGIPSTCTTMTMAEVYEYINLRRMTIADFYRAGYRPVKGIIMDPEDEPEAWSLVECADCRATGGTKNKPDYWPNDHK